MIDSNKRVTELDPLDEVTPDDLFYMVDSPTGTVGQNKLPVAVLDGRYLLGANNLSDLENPQEARINLGGPGIGLLISPGGE